LTQNLWERFGFRDNPYDTRALSLSPESALSVAAAFVGRDKTSAEWQLLTNFLRNPGGGCVAVEGDVGVGKTTFVNFHRYLWETEAEMKLLTPASEISVQGDWTVREFLLSVIGALAGRFALKMGPTAAAKDELLTEVTALTGVLVRESLNLSGGVSILGSGATGGKSRSTTVHRGEVSLAALKDYLDRLLQRVRKLKYAGAILHLNNLELLARDDPRRLTRFFDETRDCLQTRYVYFIFVGYTGMFQEVIVPVERVRSIFFGHPIHLPSLSRKDVQHAIQLRYKLLALKPGKWIPPVDDELIDHLYDAFDGRIRFIMDAVTTLVTRLPEGVTATLSATAARELLQQLASERVRALLTDAEQQVLLAAVEQGRFTNSSLAQATGKSKQNVAKYLRRLIDLNFARLAEKRGRSVYYEISAELALLRSRQKSLSLWPSSRVSEKLKQRHAAINSFEKSDDSQGLE
jgi:DNA-binding transcriptional ArsR family regulator